MFLYQENLNDNNIGRGHACGDESNLLMQSSVYNVELLQSRISELLQSYYSGLWMSKISTVYSEMFGQKLHPQVLKDLEKWTHVCMVR